MSPPLASGHDGAILAAVIRASLDCIIVVDEDSRVIEFNPAAERTFGYDRAFVLGQPIGELIVPPHLRQAHSDGFRQYLGGGEAHVLGRRVRIEGMRADGQVFPVELTIVEVLVGGRRLFTASLRDLTEREAAETAVRASEARFAAFMANAPIGMYLKDEHGRLVLANAEMRAAFPEMRPSGRPDDGADPMGRSAADLLPEETASAIAVWDADVLASGRPRTDEWHRPDLDRYRWAETLRFPVQVDGAPPQIGGFVIDLTARKAAEQALEKSREALHQSEKLNALGSLLAGVSHELNNPLSAVIGQAMMLEEDAVGTAFAVRGERIRVAAERCARIVEIFLAMARRKPPQRADIDVNAVIGSALELLAYGLRASGVETRCELAAALPTIHADGDQLHQVLVNLIVNAQQALEGCAEPRELTLRKRLAPDRATVELEVQDNGPGIPAADARRIFEPFFTTKPAGSGTGVGLSFSLGVVEAHGGTLRLKPVDAGTCFVLALPIERSEGATCEDAPADSESPSGPGVALIVDDDPDVAEALGELVQREGYAVEIVGGGAAARASLTKRDYDLVLTDLRMPDMDGPALFAWVVRERAHVAERFGFLTGDVLSPASAAFLAGSGRPYVEKPFTPASVRQLIAAVLRDPATP